MKKGNTDIINDSSLHLFRTLPCTVFHSFLHLFPTTNIDKRFMYIISVIPSLSVRRVLLFSPLYRWRNWSPELVSALLRVSRFRRCQGRDSNSAWSHFTICAPSPSALPSAISLLSGVLSPWPVLSFTHSYRDPLVIRGSFLASLDYSIPENTCQCMANLVWFSKT